MRHIVEQPLQPWLEEPVDVVLPNHVEVGWLEHIAGVWRRSGCSSGTRGIDNDRSATLAQMFTLTAIMTILTPPPDCRGTEAYRPKSSEAQICGYISYFDRP